MTEPSEAQLKAVAGDVVYEVERLFQAATLYPKTPEDGGKRLLIEALLLHFRNVTNFFYGDPKWQDDVNAAHFFLEPTEWQPPAPDWYVDYKKRCNKLLAHLTYSRATYKENDDMAWVLEDKLLHIQGTWGFFLKSLPLHRQTWFRH